VVGRPHQNLEHLGDGRILVCCPLCLDLMRPSAKIAAKRRELIDRNRTEFEQFWELTPTAGGNSGPTGGRPSIVYLLNFKQALCYCQLSQAPRAVDVREVRMAVQAGGQGYRCDGITGFDYAMSRSSSGVSSRSWECGLLPSAVL